MRENTTLKLPSETRRGILVLGAGRSGTSTLVRGLGALGAHLGTHFHRPVRKNPHGNCEEVHLLRLSKSVRRAVGLRADSVRLLDENAWNRPEVARLKRRMLAAIERHFGGHPVWAFKYAGNGRILPFWIDLLTEAGMKPAFVFSYRNPLSIAPSRAKLDRRRGRLEKSALEWLANVVPYFHRLQGLPLVVVDYDRLVDDPRRELLRVADGLGLPVSDATTARIEAYTRNFLRSDLRHTRFDNRDLERADSIHPLVPRAARLLASMARGEADLHASETWDEWRQIRDELRAQTPMLELVDQLEADARRARWWDLSVPARLVWNKLPLLRVR